MNKDYSGIFYFKRGQCNTKNEVNVQKLIMRRVVRIRKNKIIPTRQIDHTSSSNFVSLYKLWHKKEGRKKGRKEGRKEGRKKERKFMLSDAVTGIVSSKNIITNNSLYNCSGDSE